MENKVVTLKSLKIENFKGIRKLDIDFDPDTNEIIGNNKVGKTSVYDAFTWLLFGTDSTWSSRFNILPTIPGEKARQARVKGVFIVERGNKYEYPDITLTLETIQKRKKSGGYTSAYLLNGEKSTKTAYFKFIEELIPRQMGNVLSNPEYFFRKLTIQEQRSFIMNVIGDVSMEDVIKSDEKFKGFKEFCGSMQPYAKRKLLISERNTTNKDIESIPDRIEENLRSIDRYKDVEGLTKKELETDKKRLTKKIQEINTSLGNISANNARAEMVLQKREVLTSLEVELQKEKREKAKQLDKLEDAKARQLRAIKSKFDTLKQEKREFEREITDIEDKHERDILSAESDFMAAEKDFEDTRKEYKKAQKAFENADDICFNCKQPLPQSMRDQAEAKYNKHIEGIKKRGKDAGNKCKALQATLEDLKSKASLPENSQKVIDLRTKTAKTDDKLVELRKEYLETEKMVCEPYPINPELLEKIEIAEKELDDCQNQPFEESDAKKKYMDELEVESDKLSDLVARINHLAAVEDHKERIEKLNKQQIDMAKKIDAIDADIDLIDAFHDKLANMLEDKVNTYLTIGEISLFEKLVTDNSLSPTCVIRVDGVEYGSLNRASKINIGIDLINTISKKADLKIPVWIDGAESVQELLKTDAQTMVLRVLVDNVSQLKQYIPHFDPRLCKTSLVINNRDKGNVLWSQVR